ncbi:hypothetical protein [Kutzneria albida]|uniref:PE domain-containing protein n=1 Tax=Kutzneria albida DSM 43870 TaxID=1449976 RepID=W5VYK7_9PSEU|nr:hypothetical protein [Kutzneria albida]AHH93627.1 hypothetical protein KALB_250 [Kutzneria albida DSM 43870]
MASIDVGGGYSIDFDDADKFRKALEDQLHALQSTMNNTAADLMGVGPGHDDYSKAFGAMGTQLVQAHREWNTAKQKELSNLIDSLKAAVDKYKQTEHDNTIKG